MRIDRRTTKRWQGGYSGAEIMLVVAIIGILAVLATPMFVRYYQGAQLQLAAEEVAAFLNQGRQLAIMQSAPICVHIASTSMHYHLGSCGGATWLGPGTDSSGNIPVPTGITMTATADPTFTHLGAAAPGATYTITHTQSSTSVHVAVAASGRVSITP
jgi:Tfp pilus assembly protein FimT